MTLLEVNLPQKRQGEREREKPRERERRKKRKKYIKKERKEERKKGRKKERTKERKRASSMPNDMLTAGKRAPQVEFLSSVCHSENVHNSICLVYAKFDGLSCMAQVIAFGWPYRFTVFRAHL